MNSMSHLWMCGASDQENEGNHEPKNDQDSYILDPFPNDKFVPDAWMDKLLLTSA